MTLKEAYKTLGASKQDDDREIKAKYKKLLILYHPDSDPTRKRNPEDDEKIICLLFLNIFLKRNSPVPCE